MKADPTIPGISVTPSTRRVSTKASLGVITIGGISSVLVENTGLKLPVRSAAKASVRGNLGR